ncbi:MAG: DUF1631 domain-containing protein [Gammaproteobacteria bacterium]|nr:DUF1631 domain-containing protein [Gammaproteobacteria bacterium]MDH5629589.1 DUF1631 domain-containing protein [Gammaproteobacteria bacterium]
MTDYEKQDKNIVSQQSELQQKSDGLVENSVSVAETSISLKSLIKLLGHNNLDDKNDQVSDELLIGCLTRLHKKVYRNQIEIQNINLKNLIKDELAFELGVSSESFLFKQYHNDILDLMLLFFDIVEKNQILKIETRNLIKQTRIAIIKSVYLEDSFFSNTEHCARRLVNLIAEIACLCSTENKYSNELLKVLHHVIEAINNDFGDNIELFEDKVKLLETEKDKFIGKASVYEARICEAEEGKAQSDQAWISVAVALNEICKDKFIPLTIQNILKNAWFHLMFVEKLKNRDKNWQKLCELAGRLVDSFQTIDSREMLNQRVNNFPVLVENINEILSDSSISSSEQHKLIKQLDEAFKEILLQVPNFILSNVDEGEIDLQPMSEKIVAEEVIDDEWNHDIHDNADDLLFPQYAISSGADESKSDNQKISLKEGEWFEIKGNVNTYYCKLAKFIEANQKYVFVNYSGMKIGSYTRSSLLEKYSQKKIRKIQLNKIVESTIREMLERLMLI